MATKTPGICDFMSLLERRPREGTYCDDLDITYLDVYIRCSLEEDLAALPLILEEKIREVKGKLGGVQSRNERMRSLEKLSELQGYLDVVKSRTIISSYILEVTTVLESYTNVKRSGQPHGSLLHYVEHFLSIARRYTPININRVQEDDGFYCVSCDYKLDNMHDRDGFVICPKCHNRQPATQPVHPVSEGTLVSASVPESTGIANFRESFSRWQCQGGDHITDEFWVKLDKYYSDHGRPPAAFIRAQPINEKGWTYDTSVSMLIATLKVVEPDYYEHINYIGHKYFGWLAHDVEHFWIKIEIHYHKTEHVLNSMSREERQRKSSLGTQYRLYRHLQMVGYPCSRDQFKIAENADSLSKHHKLWRKMCEGANDPEIFYIEHF